MICLICRQAETTDSLTSVVFERGEIKVVIKHVPAYRCPSCGEVYVEDHVAIRLLHGAEEKSVAGELDVVGEYESL